MAWRVAYSLNTLLDQLNTLAPGRNKASDGSIGDPAHSSRVSDHNPDPLGIVRARDFTHDPVRLSGGWVADTLTAHRDPRIKYVIWNRRIWNHTFGWQPYSGSNPHTSHVHLSVVADGRADYAAPWAGFIAQPPKEPEVELTDPMRPYFSGPGSTWPEDVKAMNVGATLANVFSFSRDNNRLGNLAVNALATVVAEVTTDPDLSAEAIKELMDQAVIEHAPAAQPVDLEAIKQVVREAAAEDNVTLADDIVDRIAARVAN